MNVDKFLKLFVPKEFAFFPLFEEGGKVLIKGTELLVSLSKADSPEQMESFISEIRKVEKDGDKVAHKIFAQLNKSFITPFDREDIHKLATKMDDVLDHINTAAQRIKLYKPKKLTKEIVEVSEILYQLGLLNDSAMKQLSNATKHREKIFRVCDEIHDLEKKADVAYSMGITDLFENEKELAEVIKLKDILSSLEKAVNKTEDVSEALKTILIKMA